MELGAIVAAVVARSSSTALTAQASVQAAASSALLRAIISTNAGLVPCRGRCSSSSRRPPVLARLSSCGAPAPPPRRPCPSRSSRLQLITHAPLRPRAPPHRALPRHTHTHTSGLHAATPTPMLPAHITRLTPQEGSTTVPQHHRRTRARAHGDDATRMLTRCDHAHRDDVQLTPRGARSSGGAATRPKARGRRAAFAAASVRVAHWPAAAGCATGPLATTAPCCITAPLV